MGNYIKLDRKILNWEWYRNLNTCKLFFHFLLKANWKDGKFDGKDIKKGSFVSSVSKLSEETGLTQREVRTAIGHLKSTGEITSKSYRRFTVFTVNNYCLYQINEVQADMQTENDYEIYNRIKKETNLLIRKYWGRKYTEADTEHVRGLIIHFKDNHLEINEDKLQLLEYAFKHSVNSNAMNWNYIHGIVRQLDNRKITNIDEAIEFDVKREFGGIL